MLRIDSSQFRLRRVTVLLCDGSTPRTAPGCSISRRCASVGCRVESIPRWRRPLANGGPITASRSTYPAPSRSRSTQTTPTCYGRGRRTKSPPGNSHSNPNRTPRFRWQASCSAPPSRKSPPVLRCRRETPSRRRSPLQESRSRHNGNVTPTPGGFFDEHRQRALDASDQPGTKVPRRCRVARLVFCSVFRDAAHNARAERSPNCGAV